MKLNVLALSSLILSINAQTARQCQNQCNGDVACLTKCMKLPNPNEDQANATSECTDKCIDASTGDVPNACFKDCVNSIFNVNDPSAKFSTSSKDTSSSSATKIQDASKTKSSKATDKSDSVSGSDSSTSTSTAASSNAKNTAKASVNSTYSKKSQFVTNIASNAMIPKAGISIALLSWIVSH